MSPDENHPQQTNTEKQARMDSPANGTNFRGVWEKKTT